MPGDPTAKPKPIPMGLLVVGSEMASFTLVGVLVDYLAGTMPVFTVLLTLLGVAAAFYHLILMVKPKASPNPPNGKRGA